jgi:sporulation integral membrane protein YlbJ
MVISELIVGSGVGLRLSRLFAKPMRWLFGVGEAGAAAYILGLVCGFPIGAKTAVSLYDQGSITKRELERLMTFCNNPGSAFVISAVGVALLGNKRVGVALYLSVILSSLTVGIVGKYFLGYKKENTPRESIMIPRDFNVKIVTDAVQSSAISMLTVCAYVVFFSALVGCVGALLNRLELPPEISACVFGFFELSSGVGEAAALENRVGSVLLCALFVGWSGLSVALQIISVSAGRDISFRPFFIAKAAQGILCAAIMGVFIKIWLGDSIYDSSALPSYNDTGAIALTLPALCLVVILLVCLYLLLWGRKSLPKSRKKL